MRIENGNVRLETDEELSFGNDEDAKLYWDGNTLVGLATISGVGTIPFTQLTDAPTSYTGEAGKSVVVNATEDGLEFTTISGGVGVHGNESHTSTFITEAAFTDLTDVPAAYAEQAGKYVAVKSTADGLEFVDAPEGGGVDFSAPLDAGTSITFTTSGTNLNLNVMAFHSAAAPDHTMGNIYRQGSPPSTVGAGQGQIIFKAYPTGGPIPAAGKLVSLDSNRKVFETNFSTYPDRPCIGMSLGEALVNPDGTTYGYTPACWVLINGGGYPSGGVNLSSARGKAVYVDNTTSGTVTITKPSTPGQVIQQIGYVAGNTYGFWFETDYRLETVGEKLPATWRFEANGNDLELKFNDGDSWNLITTFSGVSA